MPLKYEGALSQSFSTLINASTHLLFQRGNTKSSSQARLLTTGSLKKQEAKGPRALPSPRKDYQFALVTRNLLPSPSFLRVLCLGAVAALRLLRSYLFRLPTKEITGDWQAIPHSVGFGVFCKRLLVLGNSGHQALTHKCQTHGGQFLNLKGRHKSFIMRSGVVF